MRIMVARNRTVLGHRQVETYSGSMVRALRDLRHEVVDVPKNINQNYDGIDLLIDIDCGRNGAGELIWQAQEGRLPVKSAVMFIDSHGYPTMHHRLAPNYDYVFFAVWDKRDLFAKHPSAHWCPNFTDKRWFDVEKYDLDPPRCDFGFFGSKGGLSRANQMIKIAKKHGWTHDVRQVSAGGKHRWPHTAKAMANCRALFNHGQKHDLNLRIFESMLVGRPLISDSDDRSGVDKLFEAWVHYIPYEYFDPFEGLEEGMQFAVDSPEKVAKIASSARAEVMKNHLVENRIDQILEVTKC